MPQNLDLIALQRVQRAFDAAADAPAEARSQLIRAACGNRPELEQRVYALLAADDDTWSLPSLDALVCVDTHEDQDHVGQGHVGQGHVGQGHGGRLALTPEARVGHYRVIDVVSATRSVARPDRPAPEPATPAAGPLVSLELVDRDPSSQRALAHFERTRSRLQDLCDPAIAKPLEAFEPSPSQVCFVTEYRHGTALLDHCHGATLDEALSAYRQVCSAIRRAHGRGVSHGHLGYSRILVTTDGPRRSVVIHGFGRGPTADDATPAPGPADDARALGALLTEVCGMHLGRSIAKARERADHSLLRALRDEALGPGTTPAADRLAIELHQLGGRCLAGPSADDLAAAVTYLIDCRTLLRDPAMARPDRLAAVERDLDAARQRGRAFRHHRDA